MLQTEALKPFIYESGYKFTAEDLGADTGVTLSLSSENDEAKILLPKEKVTDFIEWLADSLCQQLPDIKERIGRFRSERGFKAKKRS